MVQTGTKQLIQALGLQLQFGELTYDQLLESRLVIEPPVASLAAQRRSVEDLAELQRLYLFMSEAEADADFLRYDIAFHEQLARCTGNGYFVLAVTPLLVTLSETRQESLIENSRRTLVLDEHRAILDAIHARDPAAAGSAMLEHIGSFARSVGLTIPMDTAGPRRQSAGNRTARPRKAAAAQQHTKESDG
ncbi:FCD domain-containing protein [Dactylosporangium sp. NBC_01737]|nr:FCD domain-containing protein [Dactylosporangium sp. NBC_01737]